MNQTDSQIGIYRQGQRRRVVSAGKHTAGPWAMFRAQAGSAFVIYGPDEFPIAQTVGNGSPEGMQRQRDGVHEANAKRIVRCVNAHDELVAALREALQYVPHRSRPMTAAKCQAAIAKASEAA